MDDDATPRGGRLGAGTVRDRRLHRTDAVGMVANPSDATVLPSVAGGPASVSGMLLAPGASGSADHPVFVALERCLAEHGVAVRRYDFASRRAGNKAVPRAEPAAAEIAVATRDLAAELGVDTSELVIGGRSFVGRVASMAVAAGLEVAGLALLSYPLHPPGKPANLRTDHFPSIGVPVLFISGDRDPFGTPAEFEVAVASIAGPVSVQFVAGGTHDPANRGRTEAVVEAVLGWLGFPPSGSTL